jgi:hypothetical protein
MTTIGLVLTLLAIIFIIDSEFIHKEKYSSGGNRYFLLSDKIAEWGMLIAGLFILFFSKWVCN